MILLDKIQLTKWKMFAQNVDNLGRVQIYQMNILKDRVIVYRMKNDLKLEFAKWKSNRMFKPMAKY